MTLISLSFNTPSLRTSQWLVTNQNEITFDWLLDFYGDRIHNILFYFPVPLTFDWLLDFYGDRIHNILFYFPVPFHLCKWYWFSIPSINVKFSFNTAFFFFKKKHNDFKENSK